MIFIEKKITPQNYIECFCRKNYKRINVGVRNKHGTEKLNEGKTQKEYI